MSTTNISPLINDSASPPHSSFQEWRDVYSDNRIKYSVASAVALLVVISIGLFTVGALELMLIGATLTAGAIGFHLRLSNRIRIISNELAKAEDKLANEASSSRILSGIRTLRANDALSANARLTVAARMATEYPAAIVFNLRDVHEVLAPSNWSYEGQLSHIRDQFVRIDDDDPGALAARQGSVIVISNTDERVERLPIWAENAGFLQGIVAPISRGLDTVGVIYVLSKSDKLPTLKEIEQLELIVSFSSYGALASGPDSAAGQTQPFRVVEKPATAKADYSSSATQPIRMEGFALNPESERIEMNGMLISLSPTEFLLMHALASSPDKPVSPAVLISSCWSKNARPADNAVDVAIFRLRKKLNRTASAKGLIKTVRGIGYMFIPPTSTATSPAIAD
ncbi:MAG: winged helix-turn-helix domain-containing protein [Dehalococcoidia bacterium]|nr:winged helix-turn-helix domain-containing protein [Dehalococcoidia bacterium]